MVNDIKKEVKRELAKHDMKREALLPQATFFSLLDKHGITLSPKQQQQAKHDFGNQNSQINYQDAVRYIQFNENNDEWEVIKTRQAIGASKDKSRKSETTTQNTK